ncbi:MULTISPECIES: APC family permease [Mycolicibacterium]|uniref:APC family permease n=1 Tax=Mycolicibacterium TaxID=1866885 RepID=UPI00190F285E|nr:MULTISPECIES: APC family permease [Mycolicibacterium]MDR7288053.1 amino acid transporter [Mycolicibacterium senegalense]QZA25041.1 APC family permease [Mycolicibacterium senegalense]
MAGADPESEMRSKDLYLQHIYIQRRSPREYRRVAARRGAAQLLTGQVDGVSVSHPTIFYKRPYSSARMTANPRRTYPPRGSLMTQQPISSEPLATQAGQARPDQPEHFKRSIGLVSNFSLGFTYLSPGAGVLSIFAVGLAIAGPPSIWWFPIVAVGQILVALVFGEVVSQYPITGGIYPWTRRLWGRRYAWMAAWIYMAALVVTTTSVVQFSIPFLAKLFHIPLNQDTNLAIALALLLIAFGLNSTGTKTLARVARIGFYCELVGVVALGLYLLLFKRQHPFGVFFDSFGVAGDGPYIGAFLMAALVGLWMFYGFEACGDVAEEVENPERKIPVAMILTIVIGLVAAMIAYAGFVLAAPNLEEIVAGNVADPIPDIVRDSAGEFGMNLLLIVAATVFLSAVLSQQAALSRLIFSFARDNMLPRSRWLSQLHEEVGGAGAVPRNAMIVACCAPTLICFWLYFNPNSITQVTAFAVLGIYVCFHMVVAAALRQRLKGWRPAGAWSLGRAGFAVNVLALCYGVAAMILLALPGDASLPFVDRWIVLIGMSVVLAAGAIYMITARPFGNSDAPEDDAIEVAARLRRERAE